MDYSSYKCRRMLEYFEEISKIPRASYKEDKIADYLCNFAKTGNPNGDGLVEWRAAKPGQKEVIRLGEGDIRMEKVCKAKLLWTTLTNKNVGE